MRYFTALIVLVISGLARGDGFERMVIDEKFPGAYQVEVADVNGDQKLDIIAVGGGMCAWYENPSWKKRIITDSKRTPGVISSATADIDGDGKAEVAIAYEFSMNEPTKGKLLFATQGKTIDEPWTVTPIKIDPSFGFESIHRLRWGDLFDPAPHVGAKAFTFEKGKALVVAPIFGRSSKPPILNQDSARLNLLFPGESFKTGRWSLVEIGSAPVLHAIDVIDLDGDGFAEILGASNLGVSLFSFPGFGSIPNPRFRSDSLVTGAPGEAPKKGCSEVHVGKLKDAKRFLTTVEPWHGTDVAVYLSESLKPLKFGARNVIDTSLKEGHALWVADVDGDGDDEIFAGFRGPGTSILMFDHDGKNWQRTVVDNTIAAQDLRGGDLDSDGRPDLVAVGGSTHNVIWYRYKK